MVKMEIVVKRIINLLGIVTLAGIILFSIAACSHDIDDTENGTDVKSNRDYETSETPYLGETLTITGQQVYTRNHIAKKVSEAYLPYKGYHDIGVAVILPTSNPSAPYASAEVAQGTMKKGILSFEVPGLDSVGLLDAGALGAHLFSLWDDVKIMPQSIQGTYIIPWAYNSGDVAEGPLDRQGIFGTSTSISCETVLYVYVKNDCIITGKNKQGYIDKQYYYVTESTLHLSLKKGWNLICRNETYFNNYAGYAKISMEIKNPIKNPQNYKWVIEPGFGL